MPIESVRIEALENYFFIQHQRARHYLSNAYWCSTLPIWMKMCEHNRYSINLITLNFSNELYWEWVLHQRLCRYLTCFFINRYSFISIVRRTHHTYTTMCKNSRAEIKISFRTEPHDLTRNFHTMETYSIFIIMNTYKNGKNGKIANYSVRSKYTCLCMCVFHIKISRLLAKF